MSVHDLTIFYVFCYVAVFGTCLMLVCLEINDSAFKGLSKSYGMELVVLAILGGQFCIVQFGGDIFRTEPLNFQTWGYYSNLLLLVLWIGEK